MTGPEHASGHVDILSEEDQSWDSSRSTGVTRGLWRQGRGADSRMLWEESIGTWKAPV